jgi:hypothetical protein
MVKKEKELPKNTEEKIENREKKRKPKMKISGKSVFQIKKLLTNK